MARPTPECVRELDYVFGYLAKHRGLGITYDPKPTDLSALADASWEYGRRCEAHTHDPRDPPACLPSSFAFALTFALSAPAPPRTAGVGREGTLPRDVASPPSATSNARRRGVGCDR